MRTLVRLPSCSAIREVQAEVCKEGSVGPATPTLTPPVAPATAPDAPSVWHNMAGMGGKRWAGMGALAGGALGALMPGKDEDGESRGALSGALRGAMTGGLVGGLGGLAAGKMWGPTGAMKTMQGATQAGEGVVANQAAGAAAAAKAQTDLANRRAGYTYDPSRTDIVQHATGRKDTWGNRFLSGVQGVLPRAFGGIGGRNMAEGAAGLVHSREVGAAGLQTKRDAELAAARAPAAAPAAAAAAPAAAPAAAAPSGPVALPNMPPPVQVPAPLPQPAPAPPAAATPPPAAATPPPAAPGHPNWSSLLKGAAAGRGSITKADFAAMTPAQQNRWQAVLRRAGGHMVVAAATLRPIDVFSPKLAARRPFSAPKQTVAERVQGAFAPRKTKTDAAPVAAEAAAQPKAAPAAKPADAPEVADDKKVAASPAVAATMPPGAGPATAVAPLKTAEVAVPAAAAVAVVEPAKAAEAAVAEPAIKVVKLAALAA